MFRPIKNRSDDEAVQVYKQMYHFFAQNGCKPKLDIMDNDAAPAVKRVIKMNDAMYQVVEPNIHQENAA